MEKWKPSHPSSFLIFFFPKACSWLAPLHFRKRGLTNHADILTLFVEKLNRNGLLRSRFEEIKRGHLSKENIHVDLFHTLWWEKDTYEHSPISKSPSKKKTTFWKVLFSKLIDDISGHYCFLGLVSYEKWKEKNRLRFKTLCYILKGCIRSRTLHKLLKAMHGKWK